MCLSRRILGKLKTSGIGYKVFRVRLSDGVLIGDCKNIQQGRPLGIWVNEKSFRPDSAKDWKELPVEWRGSSPGRRCYPLGFHVFATLKAAKEWVGTDEQIWVVRYRRACAQGIQAHRRVVIAKKIKIIRRVEV